MPTSWGRALVKNRLGKTRNLHRLRIGEETFAELEIAMIEPALVRSGERVGDLHGSSQRLGPAHLAALSERTRREPFHREPRDILLRATAKDAQPVRMIVGRQDFHRGIETFRVFRSGTGGKAEYLDGKRHAA